MGGRAATLVNRQRRRARGRQSAARSGRIWMVWAGAAAFVAVVAVVAVVWGGPSGADIETDIALPDWVREKSRSVQAAYVYAVERPDVLSWMPCYCGCGDSVGHLHNEDCFVGQRLPDGRIAFDNHGVT